MSTDSTNKVTLLSDDQLETVAGGCCYYPKKDYDCYPKKPYYPKKDWYYPKKDN